MARILIVDDTLFMRKLLIDIFVAQGHEIAGEGGSAQEAVEKFRALKPDLMTLDIEMPQESPLDSLGAVRTITGEDPKAKIIIVSSLSQRSIITEMLTAGACDFIVKPFHQDRVIKTVDRILRG